MLPRPVVKWAGGKSRLTERLISMLPLGRFATYAEPFFGGGAMFFALASEPKRRFDRAILSDKNAELVALYRALKTDVEAVVDRLRDYRDQHLALSDAERREHFYEVRELDATALGDVERGARLVFLNKTCFNGLWRVNAKGRFNVPFGKYATPKILDSDVLYAASAALADATIVLDDFAVVTKELVAGDFAYFDPPYVPVSKTANFTAYASPFGRKEQERLATELVKLKKRGVKAMLSNASTAETRKLYALPGIELDTIRAARSINSDPTKRGDVSELIVTNYRPRVRKKAAG